MASSANDGRPEIRVFIDLFISRLLKGLGGKSFGKQTVADTVTRLLVTIGALAGAVAFGRLYPSGVSGRIDWVIAFCLVSAGATAGRLCSFRVAVLVRKCLPRNVLLRDDLEEWVRLVKGLDLPPEAVQFLITLKFRRTYKWKGRIPLCATGTRRCLPPPRRSRQNTAPRKKTIARLRSRR